MIWLLIPLAYIALGAHLFPRFVRSRIASDKKKYPHLLEETYRDWATVEAAAMSAFWPFALPAVWAGPRLRRSVDRILDDK